MDGILSILKPPGITSHDAVSIVRRILGEKKVGHSGTLDPLAGGVLPIYIGKATRLIEYGESFSKTYIAEGKFGCATDTEDISGEVIESVEPDVEPPEKESLISLCSSFVGEQTQRPSIYSAIKINGKKAYELARTGKHIDMPERTVYIYDIELLRYDYPYFVIKVSCSGGTYIRSLIRDFGKLLGIPTTMSHLLRTQVGPYNISQSFSVEEIELNKEKCLFPISKGVEHIASYEFSLSEKNALCQGRYIQNSTAEEGIYAAYFNQEFFGVVKKIGNIIKAEKILYV